MGLVIIDYIRWKKIDGIDLVKKMDDVQIYGTVIVSDCYGHYTVYHRSLIDTEKLPDKYLSLTTPCRPVDASGPVTISLKLRVKLWDDDDDPKVIARGTIQYIPFRRGGGPREEDVFGEHGSVTVGYTVTSEALTATIDVMLMNNESPAAAQQIYGTIKACGILRERKRADLVVGKWVAIPGSTTTTTLFDKPAKECVKVNPEESILVAALATPVSVDYDLKIEVDLWADDNQVAVGGLQFTPTVGTLKKSIGQVQVSITCNHYS